MPDDMKTDGVLILEENGQELVRPGSSSDYAQDVERRLRKVHIPEEVRETDHGRLVELEAATLRAREQEREIAWWMSADRGRGHRLTKMKHGYGGGSDDAPKFSYRGRAFGDPGDEGYR